VRTSVTSVAGDDSPDTGGLGSSLDMVKVRERLDRHLRKRGSLLERVERLALTGARRDKSRAENAYDHRPMPSDPPIVQMLMLLAEDLENGDWKKIDDDFRRSQIRNQITKQMTDLIDSLEDRSADTFKEYCQLIDQHMRTNEHADKMAHLSGRKDEDLSDAELTAKAQRLGITMNGTPND